MENRKTLREVCELLQVSRRVIQGYEKAGLVSASQILYLIEFVEIALLALYFVWTLITVNQLERSKEKVETQKKIFEQLSYSDTLTMTYNRNKYNEETEKYQGMDHFQVGIAVFDLNGLKKINDEQR